MPTGFSLNTLPTLRLSRDRASLLLGTSNGKLYRMTNTATPTVTAIDGNAFPQYTSVSSIDIGANDNELLVTLSNFGVQSVWYTSDGGATWVSKDAAGYGLPDVPVRTVLFNPQNRQQVLLGTDAGIFTTNSITASNPGWEYNSSQLGTVRVNQLRYRPADGRVAAATDGRGVFTTDALAIPYTASGISITGMLSRTVCAGNMNMVAYSGSGPAFGNSTTMEIWLSDAARSFATGTRLSTFTAATNGPGTVGGTASFTIPSGLLSGNYELKLVVPSADIETLVGQYSAGVLTVTGAITVRITDRVTFPWYTSTSSYVCTDDPVRLNAATTNAANGSAVAADTYQWLLSGATIAGATSQTYLAGLVGNYQVAVQQSGCAATSSGYSVQQFTYGGNLNINSRFGDLPQCDDSPPTLVATYTGEQAAIQWTRDGADISGATSSTYVATQSGSYSCRITRSGCTAFPQSLAVTLSRSLLADLAFSSSGDSVLCSGASKTSVFMGSSRLSSSQLGVGGFQLNWYRDNVLTAQYQNTPYLYTTQPGRYSYELRQGTCVTRSNAVVVNEGTVIPPTISLNSDYVSKSACPLDSRSMYLGGNNNTTQWQRDGMDIPGATNYSYTVQLTGVYTVRVQKGSCTATSLPVSLTFSNALRPVVYTYGSPVALCSGTYLNASDNVSLNGTQYQWFLNGTPIGNTNTSRYFVSSTGLYSVSVTNGSCTGLSKPVYMRTGVVRKPIVIASKMLNLCAGNATYLYLSSLEGSQQWKRNGITVSTGSPYSFYATQSGLYTLQVTTSCGVAESDPVEVKIGEPTSASLSGGAFVSSGQMAQLPVLLSGPAPWSFTLSNGQSVQNTYLNPHMVSVTAAATSTYTLTGLQNACGTGNTFGQATLTVGSGQADLSVVAQVSSRVARLNDVITYSLQVSNAGPQDASGVQIVNRLPVGVEFVEAITSGISEANGVVTGIIGTVQANVPVTAAYRVRITQPGAYFSAAEVTATNTPDPDSQPNSGTGDGQDDAALVDLRTPDAGSTVRSANPGQVPLPSVISGQPPVPAGKVELSLDVSSSALAPKIGEVVNLSIVVANRGALTATYVVVQVLLPVGWAVSNGAGFVVTGQTVQAYLYQLPAGVPQVLILPVQANSTGAGTIRVQILDVAETVANAIPGNGFQNGERDEANLQIQVR